MKTLSIALALPLLAQSLYDRGNEHFAAGRLVEAEAAYRGHLKANPHHVEALANLGSLLSRREQFSQAISFYQRALKLRQDLAPLHLNLGLAYFKTRQWASAAASFEKLPGNRQAAQLRGMCLLELERYDDAAGAFEALLPAADTTVLIGLATAYVKSGRGAEAQKLLAPLIASGDSPELQLILGQALFQEGQNDDALAAFRKARELKPDLPMAGLYIGAALWKKKQNAEAVAEWRRERNRFPSDAEAAYTLGAALLLTGGDPKETESLLRGVLAKKPARARANYQLAKLIWQQRKAPEAIPCLERSVKSDPNLREAHYLLARIYQSMGRKADADRMYARVKVIADKERSEQLDLFSEPPP